MYCVVTFLLMFVEDKAVITNTPTKTGVGPGKILGCEWFFSQFSPNLPEKNCKK